MALSFSAPVNYAAAAPQLGIPACLNSDPLLQLTGAKSVIKVIPAATGSAVGPSSQVQFLIPQSLNGFIKPSSMYLKCKITITQAFDNNNIWTFAGQAQILNGNDLKVQSVAPASSVIDRITVSFPGGVSFSYPNYNKYEWGLVLSHMLSREYVQTDLRMLMQACTIRLNEIEFENEGGQIYACIPLDLPCFNSYSAVPLCLLSGGITLDIVTSSVAEAFTVAANPAFSGDISTFALSDMTVVYDELQVSPEFMSALRNKVSMQPFTIGIQDRTWLGICDGRNPTRVNIGVGLSSMKALVGINVYGNSTTRDLKYSAPNGLKRWSLFINGQQINSMNLDSDVQNYIEFTRAIQSMYDLKRVSCAYPVTNDAASTTRSTIQTYQFAFGLSTAVYSDVNFALSGIPVDQLSVEFDRQANPDPVKWGGATTNLDGFLTHMWALHDSVMTILPDGTVSIRK